MATITSRLPVLVDYFITLFTNASTLGAATPAVQVLDGPFTTMQDNGLKLFVGWTDPDDVTPSGQPAGESQQSWGALGRLGRNEIVTIHCCAEAWGGGPDIKSMRAACTGITAAVEALMQSDTTQFGGNVLMPYPGLTNVSQPQSNAEGNRVRQSFDLIFWCRIGGF